MFSENVKATLLCGPKKLSESFMFEAATYWAEKGRRVIYIAPVPLEKRPGACHDRSDPTVVALKLMRFVYLKDYESLVEHLIKLHTYAAVPSVLLIDSLDDYLNDEAARNNTKMFIAKTCALILHSMNSCSRVLNMNVHVCVWASAVLIDDFPQTVLFRNIWNLTEKEDGKVIVLEKFSGRSSVMQSYKYRVFEDGMRVLQQVIHYSSED